MAAGARRKLLGMRIEDYCVTTLLVISTALWIDLLRLGLKYGWSWPVQPRRDVPWRTLEAVAAIVIVLLCINSLLRGAINIPLPPPYTVRFLQINTLSQLLQLILAPLILAVWCRCRWSDFGLRRTGVLLDLKFAVWGVLIAQLPVYLLSYPLQSIRSEKPHPLLEFLQTSAGDSTVLLWIAINVIIMAPLVEELLFRVLLQGALEREVRTPWALLMTSTAFVCIHSEVDWLPLLPLALTLSYVYYRRRSYLSVVVLHALFNALNLLGAVWTLKPPVSPP